MESLKPVGDLQRGFAPTIDNRISSSNHSDVSQLLLEDTRQAIQELCFISNIELPFREKLDRIFELGCSTLGLSVGILMEITGNVSKASHIFPSNNLITLGSDFSHEGSCCEVLLQSIDEICCHSPSSVAVERKVLRYGQLRTRTYIGGVVRIGEKIFGTLSFSSPFGVDLRFSDLEKKLVELIIRAVERELRQRSTQEALTYRIEFEKLIATISTSFISLSVQEVDRAITKSLAQVGEFAGVDSTWIFRFSSDGEQMDNTHGWLAKGVSSQKINLRKLCLRDYPFCVSRIMNRELIHVPVVADLPEEANPEKASLTTQGIQSLILVPLTYGKKVLGFLGFSSIRHPKRWDEEEIGLLKMVGQIFANALAHKEAEEERRMLEMQMQHAQKLESLGVLTGGIAHDFNNLLMGILGNADLALMHVNEGTPAFERVSKVRKTAARAAELTNQMLVYSGRAEVSIKPVNISKLASEMVDLLDTVISKRILIKCNFAVNPPPILADATQIRQVIMNLVTNASEAIYDQAGVVNLSTGITELTAEDLESLVCKTESKPGQYVFLQVTDSGCGMDAETVRKMFDPFFSTKFTGRGLGLAVTLSIVKSHGGVIRVETQPGKGTTFRVYFPLAVESTVRQENTRPGYKSWERHGVVLVIDDDDMGRQVTRDMLHTYGYKVLIAAGGREGIEAFRKCANEVVLVLLDMTMPDLKAEEVFKSLRSIRGDVCVVLTSGFSEDEAVKRFSASGLAGFIQKPFVTGKLVEKVEEVVKRVR